LDGYYSEFYLSADRRTLAVASGDAIRIYHVKFDQTAAEKLNRE